MASSPPPLPHVGELLGRIEALRPAYARAVQRVLARGFPVASELLIAPVDRARERAARLTAACRRGEPVEGELVETYAALARLMEMLIAEAG